MSFNDPNTPAAATPAAPVSPTSVSEPVAQQTIPVAPASPATPATPSEDRSNWVPPYRLREATQRHEQQLAAERAQWQAQQVELTKRIQALAGVAPSENQQFDDIRNQFKQVFPDQDWVGGQRAAIEELIQLKDELKASMQAQWESHNRHAMNMLYKDAETTYGTPLTEDAKRTLGASFVGYLQSNPDAYSRYQSDPSVASEFWKAFSDRFVDPARRQAVVNTAQRIPNNLPQDSPSGIVQPGQAPKAQSQDELLRQALDVYKAKSQFGFGE